ncbi:MAG: metal-dependent hydrolase [Hyphomicrobium sp.]
MANFTTHIAAGTVVAGALATLTLAADVVSPENVVAVTLAGVLGSVLPDIDLKDSRPSRAMFAGLGIFFSFVVLFTHAERFSIAELWILWLGTLVFVRYGLQSIFHRMAVHRGVWHSILGAVFSSVLTALAFWYLLVRPEGVAWLAAAFLFAGYLVHLALDEIYSVDVMDTRVKASFGTAMKLADLRHPGASAAMAAATALAIWAAPPASSFVDGVASRDLWAGLSQRMLPEHTWFGLVDVRGPKAAADAAPGSGPETGAGAITTGSLPDATPQSTPATEPTSPQQPQ